MSVLFFGINAFKYSIEKEGSPQDVQGCVTSTQCHEFFLSVFQNALKPSETTYILFIYHKATIQTIKKKFNSPKFDNGFKKKSSSPRPSSSFLLLYYTE